METPVVSGDEVVSSAEKSVVTDKKFCKHCGQSINAKAVVCVHCGCDVSEAGLHAHSAAIAPQIVINNSSQASNVNAGFANGIPGIRLRSKWVALLLCTFLGWLGAHKFYEGKPIVGLLYMFTLGFVFIGPTIDFFILLFKPNPYAVV